MQDVIQQVQRHLSSMGYEMRPAFYQETNPEAARAPKGELVSFHNRSGIAELWLESRKLWPQAQTPSSLTLNATCNAHTRLSFHQIIANGCSAERYGDRSAISARCIESECSSDTGRCTVTDVRMGRLQRCSLPYRG